MCDIVQEAVIKNIPKKNAKGQNGCLRGFTNSCERREAKSKGEKERYKHLNAEFQRIAKRDKKAFLRDQCKEVEENNRMGRTREVSRIHRKAIQKRNHDPDSHDGMITHLDPDILKCKVKWALGSITTNKASECVGIPV